MTFLDNRAGHSNGLIVSPRSDYCEMYSAALALIVDDFDYAEDGRDALAKVFGLFPTVVVTDEQLPFFNGDILCSMLRNDPLTSDVRVVLITADAEWRTGRAGLCGADRVLAAPVEPQQLSRAVAEAIDTNRLQSAIAVDDTQAVYQHLPARGNQGNTKQQRSDRTTTPPVPPPTLHCPSCDHLLHYLVSYIGGPKNRREQWDSFVCHICPEQYEYRHCGRLLRPVRS